MKRLCPILCSAVLWIGLSGFALGQDATSQPAASQGASEATMNAASRPGGEQPPGDDTAAGQPESQPGSQPASQPGSQPASGPAEPEGLSVSFKGMAVEQVANFLGEQLGKPVLYGEEASKKKITILSKEKLPKDDALFLIRQALLDEGLMVEEQPNFVRIRPVGEVMQAHVPRLGPDVSATTIDNPLQIVTKEFTVQHCDVGKLVTVLTPMKSAFAQILADPDARLMVVTDTVANLTRMEHVVAGMDIPLAEGTQTRIIKLEHGDASEIISIVRWLIAGRMGIHIKEITVVSGGGKDDKGSAQGQPQPGPSRGGPPSGGPSRSGGGGGSSSRADAAVTRIEPSTTPVTLVPHLSRNWIIAVAPAPIMEQIVAWAEQLDVPREDQKDYELIDIEFADVEDVAMQLQRTITGMPNPELRDATHVVPYGQSRKIIVFGSLAGRQMVRDLLIDLDVEDANKRARKNFELKFADAAEMATRIESLFSGMELTSQYGGGGRNNYSSYRRDQSAAKVTVVADTRRNAITVITDPKTMEEIEKLIAEEDQALALEAALPKTYPLQYVDPGEVKELLDEMFGAKEQRQMSFWDMYYGGSSQRDSKPVGRLQGQFSFQVMPSSNMLIVSAKNPAHFKVIDAIIAELDQPQRVGLPEIVELNHANAEDLCEQLNAMLAEPGTQARIRRADRGLTEYQRATPASEDDSSSRATGQNRPPEANAGEMGFWWQTFRRPQGQVPTSNLIGKIRIVPVYRRNAVMVLAPEGYKAPICEMIAELDKPSQQVMVTTRIGEIEHKTQTTLGLRIASDPSLLNVGDSAIAGAFSGKFEGVFGSTLTIGSQASFAAMLNMLMKNFDMKILLEPTLTTADNEAAQFFDGQDVPTQKENRISAEGASTVTAIEYRAVGTLLRVRPHITIDGYVDLMVNLEISRILPGATFFGNPTIDRREVTTHVVVKNGQTVMLSGIIRQDDFDEVRKVPLLGDLPLVGKAFRSIDRGIGNRELVIFLTPHVMSTDEDIEAQLRTPMETLHKVEGMLNGEKAEDGEPESVVQDEDAQ